MAVSGVSKLGARQLAIRLQGPRPEPLTEREKGAKVLSPIPPRPHVHFPSAQMVGVSGTSSFGKVFANPHGYAVFLCGKAAHRIAV
jgi:hypothetical protein